MSSTSFPPTRSRSARGRQQRNRHVGGGYTPFTMRVDQPPFDDVRVRQAFRLICDRQYMLDTVFSGNGRIGNDVFGLRDIMYDSALPSACRTSTRPRACLQGRGTPN